MLRRLLRSFGGQDEVPGRRPTYAETLLEPARDVVADALRAGTATDPLVTLGKALVDGEVSKGLSPPPTSGMAREQFLRTYATLLLDNDKSVPGLQIGGDDLVRPRNLLLSFFTGAGTIQREAQTVLRFIEQRFTEGRFGQARLLLQLFDTDAATRRNNERNLFYEEQILCFMSKREADVEEPKDMSFDRAVAESLSAPGEGLVAIAHWLEQHAGVRLNVLGRPPSDVTMWEETLAEADHDARAVMLDLVPGWRWRSVVEHLDRSLADVVFEQVTERGLRAYVSSLTRAVYFVTLAPGSTGFESLLMRYLEWIGANFDTVPTRLLPEIHRDSTIGESGVGEALAAAYDGHLGESRFGSGAFSREAVAEALTTLHERLRHLDLAAIPEGEYDLGGMVFDELVGLEYEDISHAFRVHRLT